MREEYVCYVIKYNLLVFRSQVLAGLNKNFCLPLQRVSSKSSSFVCLFNARRALGLVQCFLQFTLNVSVVVSSSYQFSVTSLCKVLFACIYFSFDRFV